MTPHAPTDRFANESKDLPDSGAPVVVTPTMIKAGKDVLADDPRSVDFFETTDRDHLSRILTEVYLAMKGSERL